MTITTTHGPCPYRVVLEGRECACPRGTPHTVHLYRSPDGKRYELELVDVEDVSSDG